ncbi:MAG: hypothetical protein P1U65_15345 [Minwuia sp.]|nr:hypothetical protein [Minwuia sp.]
MRAKLDTHRMPTPLLGLALALGLTACETAGGTANGAQAPLTSSGDGAGGGGGVGGDGGGGGDAAGG